MSLNNIDKITPREMSDDMMRRIDFLGDEKTSKEYYVTNTSGAWKEGAVIPQGTLVSNIIEGMLDSSFTPIYKSPELYFDITTAYETGDTFSPIIQPVFVKNDGGEVTGYELYRTVNGVETQVKDSLVINAYNETGITTDTTGELVSYRAVVHYAEGEYKKDEDGYDIEGKILAGKLECTVKIICYRASFFEASSTESTPVTTSEEIRLFPNKIKDNATSGTKMELQCLAGTTRVTFAFPKSAGDSCVIKSSVLGYDVTGAFVESEVIVEGSNKRNSDIYKVFTYIPAVPFPTTDTYTLTIK